MSGLKPGGGITKVLWSKADDNAKDFPGSHLFGSTSWQTERHLNPIGEQRQLGYRWLRPKNLLTYKGNVFFGSLGIWLRGAAPGDPVRILGPRGECDACGDSVTLLPTGGVCGGSCSVWLDFFAAGSGGISEGTTSPLIFTATGGTSESGLATFGSGYAATGGISEGTGATFGVGFPSDGGISEGTGATFGVGFPSDGGISEGTGATFGVGYVGTGGISEGTGATFGIGWTTSGGISESGDADWSTLPGSDDVTGMIVMWGKSAMPTGWLECDGSAVSQASFPALYAILGTNFGPDTGGNFTLPDFRGRVPVGAGTGSGLTARTLAITGGEETHLLSSAEMPSHTHPQQTTTMLLSGVTPNVSSSAFGINTSTGGTTQATGGGGSHNNMQPFLAPKFIIKT